jgi:uncharacterized protein with NAD-binding domain and iron-sulfur cluster
MNSGGFPLGVPACPLQQLYDRPPCRDLRLGVRVSDLIWKDGRVSGVRLLNGEVLAADIVILATNHHAVQRWLPAELAPGLAELQSVPILGVHLWFDRPVLATSHVAFIEGPLQWLFRKDAEGCAVHGVISAARDWVDVPKEECLAKFWKQIQTTIPAARDAVLQRGVVVIEKRATFSPLPGVDRLRPAQRTAVDNLFLAGDFTQTGWPATMEGAVRGGYLAAEQVVRRLTGGETAFLQPDLPPEWPARLLNSD